MAIEDYFKGSSQAYGQLAGSLLAGRRKEDKKEAKRALLASVVMNTFGALQNQQKQSIIDGSNDVKDKYQDIFDNNEEIYNKKRGARADYLAYKENPNDYIETKAAELFNKDLELQAELGTNPYSRISKADLTPESYESAMEVLDDKRKIAKEYIEAQAGNAAVTTQTLTKFNAAAKEEYEAAMAEVKDDPYKQGLIRSAFSKIFGIGEEKKNKLLTDLQTAKTKRMQQESTIPYMDTVKGKEELINKKIIDGTDKVKSDGFAYDTKTLKWIETSKINLISVGELKESKNFLSEQENRISNSKTEVKSLIEKANDNAEKNIIETNKNFHLLMENRKKNAEERIKQMKNQALKDIKNTSVKIALESVEKLLKNSVDKSKLDKIYLSSIEETKLALKKKSS